MLFVQSMTSPGLTAFACSFMLSDRMQTTMMQTFWWTSSAKKLPQITKRLSVQRTIALHGTFIWILNKNHRCEAKLLSNCSSLVKAWHGLKKQADKRSPNLNGKQALSWAIESEFWLKTNLLPSCVPSTAAWLTCGAVRTRSKTPDRPDLLALQTPGTRRRDALDQPRQSDNCP